MANKAFPTHPYEHEFAEDFIKATKRGDIDELQAMLSEHRLLLFEFDSVIFLKESDRLISIC